MNKPKLSKRLLLLALLLSGLLFPGLGCTNLDKVDLSCEIPLTPANEVGIWHKLAGAEKSERFDNMYGNNPREFSPSQYRSYLRADHDFYLGGRRYTLHFSAGSTPQIYDQNQNRVTVTLDGRDYNSAWYSEIACSKENIGKSLNCHGSFTLRFIDLNLMKTCVVTCGYSISIQIRKSSYYNGTSSVEYPYADIAWSIYADCGLHHCQKGEVQLPGEVTMRATLGDSNLDGVLDDRDNVYVSSSGRGISLGGFSGVYTLNRMITAGKEYGYRLTLKERPGTEPGQDGAPTKLYTLVIQREPIN